MGFHMSVCLCWFCSYFFEMEV